MGEIKKICFGAYENEGKCESCPLALICIERTIAADGYYDQLAKEERWMEEMEVDLMDARFANERL